MKTEILKYNLYDRGRKHTGQDRSDVDVEKMIDRINAPDTQELVKTGGLFGYYGHQIRQRFGMNPPETAMINGKKIHLEPAFRTIYLKAHKDGTVEHQAEFLDNEAGQYAKNQYKAKAGGFSTAVSYIKNGLKLIPKLFAGFDYVFQPNYATNVGNGVLLDGLYCSDELNLFDDINEPQQAQIAQVLEQAIIQNYDHIHQSLQLIHEVERAYDSLAQEMDKQVRYAQAKAKHNQQNGEEIKLSTISFDSAIAQANAFFDEKIKVAEEKGKILNTKKPFRF